MRAGKDRLVEAFLEEVVGGQNPPDLSQRVLEALAKRSGKSLDGNGVTGGATPNYSPSAGSGQAAGGDVLPQVNAGDGGPSGAVSVAARKRRSGASGVLWFSLSAAAAVVMSVAIYIVMSGPAGPVAENPNPAGAQPQPNPPRPPALADNDRATDGSSSDEDADNLNPETIDLDPRGRDPLLPRNNGPDGAQVAEFRPTESSSDADVIAFINSGIAARWRIEKVSASPEASDAEWCRRVYLDLIGRIPTLDELQRFITARGADKRAALVDELLNGEAYTEEYARNWTTIWTNTLIGRSGGTDRNSLVNRQGMQQYLRRSFQRNKPYDRMVYELVSATGVNTPGEQGYNGAVNFILDNLQENAATATAKTARYFLGMQVQCTQCHNHPFNDSKQNQFWELNSFFRQAKALRERSGREIVRVELIDEDFAGESGASPEEAEVFYELRNGLMESAYPVFVDGRRIDPQGWVSSVNRRQRLAHLITTSEFMSRAMVNRLWAHFLGHGFTKPIDDMGPHNPPSHPELLDRLAREFAGGGYDLKRLMRWITLSEPYSLSSKHGRQYKNEEDDPALGTTPLFTHFYLRQMRAEELYESLLVATAAHEARGSFEEQERLKSDWLDQFTIAFGTDEGDEMTTFNGSIPQVLMMMNGALIERAVDANSSGVLQEVAAADRPNSQNINHLYLAALARTPSRPEVTMANQLLAARGGDATSALEDIWWAVLNSNEFILNH